MSINVLLKPRNHYPQDQLLTFKVLKRYLKCYNSVKIKSYQTLRFKYVISSLKSYYPSLPNVNLSFEGTCPKKLFGHTLL